MCNFYEIVTKSLESPYQLVEENISPPSLTFTVTTRHPHWPWQASWHTVGPPHLEAFDGAKELPTPGMERRKSCRRPFAACVGAPLGVGCPTSLPPVGKTKDMQKALH